MLPGESLPSSAGGGGEPWVPCPHGGLAFSYAEDPQQKHARDKIFEVTGGSVSAGDHASFGEHGGWVRVYPIELRPTLTDLSGTADGSYSLPAEQRPAAAAAAAAAGAGARAPAGARARARASTRA
eukprot:COSAG04_NODE_7918_length_1046_cov_2.865892_1_plen_125_part_10